LYASAVIDNVKKELIVKLINIRSTQQSVELNIAGIKITGKTASVNVLAGNDLYSYNTLESIDRLMPVTNTTSIKSNKLTQILRPYSVNVIKISYSGK